MEEGLSSGSVIAHYEIASRLGAGGMGEVYLATDRVLGRRVAIKFLAVGFEDDAAARERFLREARAAARLTHPNVCQVYEINAQDDRVFIVMQYVEGETLAERIARVGPLPARDVAAIASDVARALSEAHAMSIVHRDIKPHNIMIDRRGYAVVLDFGLAKLAHDGAALETSLTGAGMITGTVPYMAPEQLLARPVDGRADLFALGAVMYEALTGRRPFQGETTAQVIASILSEAPPVPPHEGAASDAGRLWPVIARCLAKKPESRYTGARQLLADLDAIRGSAVALQPATSAPASEIEATAILEAPASRTRRRTTRRKAIDSLAVLPFEAAGSGDAEVLSEGIAESLIHDLSRLPKLRVMARTTVSRYRGSDLTASQIGEQLGVRAVLSGRVQAFGGRTIVRAELVDVADGSVAWSDQFTRGTTDVLDMQEEIAREITTTLRPRLSPSEKKRVIQKRTRSPEAYQHYATGTYFLNRRDMESMRKATESFQAAIAADPTFAAPYCGLAETYVYFGFLEIQRPREVYPAARAAALKALELDPSFAEAHAALGWMKVTHEWDWAGAERELTEAARLNPNCAIAHHWHGLLLSYTRRFEQALPKVLLAQQLDPLAPIVNTLVGTLAWHRGETAEALRHFDKVASMTPGFVPVHLYRGLTRQAMGDLGGAAADFSAGLEFAPRETLLIAALGNCRGAMGEEPDARALLRRLEEQRAASYASAYGIALVWAGIGDRDEAYRWLDEAWDERSAWLCTLQVDTRWDGYRSEDRFRELVRRMGFP